MTRSFEITCINGMYHLDGKRIDSEASTVIYVIRHMRDFPHSQRPSHHLIRAACNEAKEKGVAVFTASNNPA